MQIKKHPVVKALAGGGECMEGKVPGTGFQTPAHPVPGNWGKPKLPGLPPGP